MDIDPHQPDAAIDIALAALNNAPLPEGMQARIAARVTDRLARPSTVSSSWYAAFSPAWWHGAVSGAAAALLIAGVTWLVAHQLQLRTDSAHPAAQKSSAAGTPVARTASTQIAPLGQPGCPCAAPKALHIRNGVVRVSDTLRAQPLPAFTAPSYPAPMQPLTAQERALGELARRADPKMLAALAPETQAKVEAQEEENFNKFFAPPPAPPQLMGGEPAAKTN